MRTVENIQWEACVQLFPQGSVDPSGNPLLGGVHAEDCPGTAL